MLASALSIFNYVEVLDLLLETNSKSMTNSFFFDPFGLFSVRAKVAKPYIYAHMCRIESIFRCKLTVI